MSCLAIVGRHAGRLALAAGLFWVGEIGAAGVEDFTFVQASDMHTPMAQSAATIARITNLTQIDLAPFAIRVAQPSFVLATGDLTEFGGGNGWWQEYLSYWKHCPFPVHHELGNHDNTWHANINPLRVAGQKPYYSFDSHGCHFVGLMTPTPQDPRPSVSEEQLIWLEADLKKTGDQTPVLVFFHHPLGGSEFASRYDSDRLLDVLRRHNTVLLMAGHSHGYVSRPIGGLDQITGGSTFGPNAGFSVISVKDNWLRAAYWKFADAAPGFRLLEKEIPERAWYPRVEIVSPHVRGVSKSDLRIEVRLGAAPDTNVLFTVDDEIKGELAVAGKGSRCRATGRADLSGLLPGAHYLRIDFTSQGRAISRSTHFYYEPKDSRAAWHAYLGASSKVSPVLQDRVMYVAAHDGVLRAFDAATGKPRWSVPTGAEILGSPLVRAGRIFVGNGAGLVLACDLKGKQRWSFQAGEAVYSAPVAAGSNLVFGCNNGVLYAVNAETGTLAWTNNDAGYAIESQPCVWRDKVFYGAWDQHLRCVDAATGKLVWKKVTEGVLKAKAAQRYYSPGDAAPVVAEGTVMIADRNFMLTLFDAETGAPAGALPKVAATGLSQDGKFVYLRRTDGFLTKIDHTGKELWSVPAGLNSIPVAPTEHQGKVYVCGPTGIVAAFAGEDGKRLWQYSAAPKLFVMSAVACDAERAYLTGFDGGVTALKLAPK